MPQPRACIGAKFKCPSMIGRHLSNLCFSFGPPALPLPPGMYCLYFWRHIIKACAGMPLNGLSRRIIARLCNRRRVSVRLRPEIYGDDRFLPLARAGVAHVFRGWLVGLTELTREDLIRRRSSRRVLGSHAGFKEALPTK
jgi:hypothetical protein